jgi:hypothetical protein
MKERKLHGLHVFRGAHANKTAKGGAASGRLVNDLRTSNPALPANEQKCERHARTNSPLLLSLRRVKGRAAIGPHQHLRPSGK